MCCDQACKVTHTVAARVWYRVATWLTEREHHRYESQHVNSLIVKLFAFQFVNSCACSEVWYGCGRGLGGASRGGVPILADGSLFYIGFWLRDMQKLGSQLVGIMVTGQLIRIGKEHVLGIVRALAATPPCPEPTASLTHVRRVCCAAAAARASQEERGAGPHAC